MQRRPAQARSRPRRTHRAYFLPLLFVVPLSAFLVGDMASAVAITTAYGAARALAVVAAVTSANDDFPAVCDAIQDRVLTLKKLVGATALVIAALIVIS